MLWYYVNLYNLVTLMPVGRLTCRDRQMQYDLLKNSVKGCDILQYFSIDLNFKLILKVGKNWELQEGKCALPN